MNTIDKLLAIHDYINSPGICIKDFPFLDKKIIIHFYKYCSHINEENKVKVINSYFVVTKNDRLKIFSLEKTMVKINDYINRVVFNVDSNLKICRTHDRGLIKNDLYSDEWKSKIEKCLFQKPMTPDILDQLVLMLI